MFEVAAMLSARRPCGLQTRGLASRTRPTQLRASRRPLTQPLPPALRSGGRGALRSCGVGWVSIRRPQSARRNPVTRAFAVLAMGEASRAAGQDPPYAICTNITLRTNGDAHRRFAGTRNFASAACIPPRPRAPAHSSCVVITLTPVFRRAPGYKKSLPRNFRNMA
jgi:hypothetical protein